MERGQERRWYQKPEFVWTIFVFALLQGVQMWRASNDAAAKSAVQVKAFNDLQNGFDSFQKSVLERLGGIDRRQEMWQDEQRRTWQAQHDDVNKVVQDVATQRRDFDGFVQRDESEKQLLQTKIDNARERLIGLEKLLQQEARR